LIKQLPPGVPPPEETRLNRIVAMCCAIAVIGMMVALVVLAMRSRIPI
jgi:hypothetical protein